MGGSLLSALGRTMTRMSAAKAARSHSASNTPTESMTVTASAEPVWMESVRTTTSAAANAASRRPDG